MHSARPFVVPALIDEYDLIEKSYALAMAARHRVNESLATNAIARQSLEKTNWTVSRSHFLIRESDKTLARYGTLRSHPR